MKLTAGLIVLFGTFLAANRVGSEEGSMKKLTPVLVVEAIEPSLSFWVGRMGFEKTMEVPDGDKLGFAALARDGIEIMYQTKASIAKEVATAGLPEVMNSSGGSSVLFLSVSDLEEIQKRVKGLDLLVPYRETTYGSKELWLQEPGGHIIGFAEMSSGEPQ